MERIRDAYGGQAQLYIELFGSVAHAHDEDLSFITQHLSIRPGAALDVGCGPGHFTELLRLRGVDASGIDLVPRFVEHARTAYPQGTYEVGSMDRLPVAESALAGVLAWYSLIHVQPDDLDGVLAELRRAIVLGGTLVVGFFDGEEVAAFEHKVVTAWRWPVDEFAKRLRASGFSEIDRARRSAQDGQRAHAAIAAIAAPLRLRAPSA